jgi:hypothetical protein
MSTNTFYFEKDLFIMIRYQEMDLHRKTAVNEGLQEH